MLLVKSKALAAVHAVLKFYMNTKVTPCWIFVDALEQADLFIHFNHSVPALTLSSHRRQRFGLMLLPPVRLKQKTVMSGKVFAFLGDMPFLPPYL